MQTQITEELVTFTAVANRLAVTNAELCGLVLRGTLPRPIRLAGRLRFFKRDIDGFLNALRINRAKNPIFPR
jgi:predicted DNA-binding transcriptional regulator AlpA